MYFASCTTTAASTLFLCRISFQYNVWNSLYIFLDNFHSIDIKTFAESIKHILGGKIDDSWVTIFFFYKF